MGLQQICNPKIWIFNLKNDKLIEKIYIPLGIANNQEDSGLLVASYVHVPGNCSRMLKEMKVSMFSLLITVLMK